MMHDVELPEGLTLEHVVERTLACGCRLESGRWSRAFFVAATLMAAEAPPCPLADWLAAMDVLMPVAEGRASVGSGEYERAG